MRKARWVLGMELNESGKTPPEGTDAFREDGKWYFWEYLYYCSKCHHIAYYDTNLGEQLFPHCPYCGTRIERSKDERL